MVNSALSSLISQVLQLNILGLVNKKNLVLELIQENSIENSVQNHLPYILIFIFIFIFYNQKFIMWGMKADCGNYLVATIH